MAVRLVYLVLFLVLAWVGAASAQQKPPAGPFETKAPRAFMIEMATGTALIAKDADKVIAPASLAKMMTVELVFQALSKGEITLDTEYVVSEHAWRTGGAPSRTSTMFAAIKSRIRVEDLLKGVIVHVANDGCIVLAEGMAGSEARFVERMNARAKALGLTQTRFGNVTGLPEAPATTSLRDMVMLARHIIATYPALYALYRQPDFEWNKIYQRNKNPLLNVTDLGVDGLATGFAEDEGFSIVAATQKNGVRLILALGGLASEKERAEEAARVLGWAQTSFVSRELYAAGEVVGSASTYGGDRGSVDLVSKDAVAVFVPAVNPERLTGRIVYQWPLRPPVDEGQEIARLKLFAGETLLREVPLAAAVRIEQGSLSRRAADALMELLFFWL